MRSHWDSFYDWCEQNGYGDVIEQNHVHLVFGDGPLDRFCEAARHYGADCDGARLTLVLPGIDEGQSCLLPYAMQ